MAAQRLRLPRGVARLVVIGAVLIMAALAWRWWLERPASVPPAPTGADSTAAGLRAATLWFASHDGDSLVSEPRDLAEQAGLHERVAALVAALEQGPRQDGVRMLPAGTLVLHVYLDDAGLVTLDLSRQFRQGFSGGARAEELVLASLVRTLAGGVPEMKHLRIVCGGVALPTLGGHFPLDQPLEPGEWP